MARSYRKPWIVDRNQFFRKHHNRRLRRLSIAEEIPDGKAYRKYGDPWSITDYRWEAQPPEDARSRWWRDVLHLDEDEIQLWLERDQRAYRRAFRK